MPYAKSHTSSINEYDKLSENKAGNSEHDLPRLLADTINNHNDVQSEKRISEVDPIALDLQVHSYRTMV